MTKHLVKKNKIVIFKDFLFMWLTGTEWENTWYQDNLDIFF